MVKGGQIVCQLLLGTHAGEHHMHVGVSGHPAQRPGSIAGVRVQGTQRRGGVCGQSGQRTALDGLHDDQRHAAFLGELVAPVTTDLFGAVVPVQIVVLQLAEIPGLIPQDGLKTGGVVVAGKAEISDASGGLLLPQPVHDAQFLGLLVPGFVQRVQQVKVDVLHPQPLELLFKDALGIGKALADPQRHLGGQVEAAALPFGNDPAHKGFALAVVVGVGRVKVVHAGGLCGVEQGFGPGLVDAAVCPGGKAHASVAQQGSAERFVVPVAVFHNSLVRQRCCSPAVPPVATSIAQFQGIKKRSAPRGADLLMFKKER